LRGAEGKEQRAEKKHILHFALGSLLFAQSSLPKWTI